MHGIDLYEKVVCSLFLKFSFDWMVLCFSFATSGNPVSSPSAAAWAYEVCEAKAVRASPFLPLVLQVCLLSLLCWSRIKQLESTVPPGYLCCLIFPEQNILYYEWGPDVYCHRVRLKLCWTLFYYTPEKAFQTVFKERSIIIMSTSFFNPSPANVASLWSPASAGPMPPSSLGTPCPPCKKKTSSPCLLQGLANLSTGEAVFCLVTADFGRVGNS